MEARSSRTKNSVLLDLSWSQVPEICERNESSSNANPQIPAVEPPYLVEDYSKIQLTSLCSPLAAESTLKGWLKILLSRKTLGIFGPKNILVLEAMELYLICSRNSGVSFSYRENITGQIECWTELKYISLLPSPISNGTSSAKYNNRSFYTCVLSYLVSECKQRWKSPCFNTNLSAILI